VVVSGGLRLDGLDWQPSAGNPKVLEASVAHIPQLQSERERAFWASWQVERESTTGGVAPATRALADKVNDDPLPPAPAGWQLFPSHCMGDMPCSDQHCDCASAHQLADVAVPGAQNISQVYDAAWVRPSLLAG
jgi:hypothetical protein